MPISQQINWLVEQASRLPQPLLQDMRYSQQRAAPFAEQPKQLAVRRLNLT
jgi:hypothetical protein